VNRQHFNRLFAKFDVRTERELVRYSGREWGGRRL